MTYSQQEKANMRLYWIEFAPRFPSAEWLKVVRDLEIYLYSHLY